MVQYIIVIDQEDYNPFLVYCRELAPGTVSLTGNRAQGDDSKHDLQYTCKSFNPSFWSFKHATTLACVVDILSQFSSIQY